MTGSQTDNFGNYQPNFGPPPIDNTPTSNAGGVIVASGNPNTLAVIALPGSLFLDQTTLTLYGTTDGTTWSAVSGGGGGGSGLAGTGSPQGAVAAAPGTTYLQTDTSSFWVKQTGSGTSGWVELIA